MIYLVNFRKMIFTILLGYNQNWKKCWTFVISKSFSLEKFENPIPEKVSVSDSTFCIKKSTTFTKWDVLSQETPSISFSLIWFLKFLGSNQIYLTKILWIMEKSKSRFEDSSQPQSQNIQKFNFSRSLDLKNKKEIFSNFWVSVSYLKLRDINLGIRLYTLSQRSLFHS